MASLPLFFFDAHFCSWHLYNGNCCARVWWRVYMFMTLLTTLSEHPTQPHKVMAAMNIFIHPQTHCQSDLDRALAPPACHLLARAFGFLMMAIGLVIT